MSEWRIEKIDIFGTDFYRAYRLIDEDGNRQYSGALFSTEALARQYVVNLNDKEKEQSDEET